MGDAMRKAIKIFACCAIGLIIFSSQSVMLKAEEIPIAGIDMVLHNYFLNEDNDTINMENLLKEFHQYKGISFAKVKNYVNIRNMPSEEGIILGKLYNNSAATILNQSGDWYEIKSGSVTGYIKAEFLVVKEEARKLAKIYGTRIAVVTTDTLKVRKKPSTESSILKIISKGDKFIVKEEKNGWVKIAYTGNKTGYIKADFVEVIYEYEEAISIEEERERLIAEQVAEQAETRVVQRREASNVQVYDDEDNINTSLANNENNISKEALNKNENINVSEIRRKIVEYALRFEGNPYVWGGTSLTNGADCSGFIQTVFRDHGISIPRTSRTQAMGGRQISISEMKQGDLIFYDKNGTINHVGIYIGNGKVITASSPKNGIRITNYNYRKPYRVVSYIK